ncbi:hypothetical protein RND71_015225 [Anisodus tanguticus]|uniref:Uncharacterized protein n=1 Tax=Anisodus tanguticus TaxID=243964 RepID=A0AAE1S627_9SOLA|nr:hypothetical protein RND71_015225 [Anisodus tanguticus]
MIQPLLGNGICGRKLIKPGGSIHQCHMIIVILTVFVVRIQFCVITDSPMYQCLEGFKPKSLNNWNSMDWSEGFVLGKPFSCQSKEVFVKFSELKLPDTTKSWVSGTMNLQECRKHASKIVHVPNGGQDLYIRIEASKQGIVLGQDNWTTEGPKEDTELPFFDLATIVNATDNFSFNKQLGEGGFGPEYKFRFASVGDRNQKEELMLPSSASASRSYMICMENVDGRDTPRSPDDRPNMSAVVLMLNGESTLPQPKDPGFLRDVIPTEVSFIRSDYDSYTANEITFSSFGAR